MYCKLSGPWAVDKYFLKILCYSIFQARFDFVLVEQVFANLFYSCFGGIAETGQEPVC